MSALSNFIWKLTSTALKNHLESEILKRKEIDEAAEFKRQHIDRHLKYHDEPVMLLSEGDVMLLRFGFFKYNLSNDAANHKPHATHGLFECVDTGETFRIRNNQKIAIYDPVTMENLDRMCPAGLASAFSYASENLLPPVQLVPFMHYDNENNGMRRNTYMKRLSQEAEQRFSARYEYFNNQYADYIVKKALKAVYTQDGFLKSAWKLTETEASKFLDNLKRVLGGRIHVKPTPHNQTGLVSIEEVAQKAASRFMMSRAYLDWVAINPGLSTEENARMLNAALMMITINEILSTLRAG